MGAVLKYGGITWSCSQDNGVFPAAEVAGVFKGEKRRALELGNDPVLVLFRAWCSFANLPKATLVSFNLEVCLEDGQERSRARATLLIEGKEWEGSGSNIGIGGALSFAFLEAMNRFYEESEEAGEPVLP